MPILPGCERPPGVPGAALDKRLAFCLGSTTGGKDPNRQPRVGSIRDTPPGWVRFATCNACGHPGVLPAEWLLRKFGDLALLAVALVSIRCSVCHGYGATAPMVRTWGRTCPRIRG